VMSLALADDPPSRVGRISTVEGQVLVRTGDGEAQNALLNWPVTTDNHLSTMRGAQAEFRLGAVAVRLDGDSELEVNQLDDDNFKLHLSYGSVSVRVRNPDALRGFELTTRQARVTLAQAGWVRIDAERQPGTSVVSVLEGVADVDGSTASITLLAGKSAELTDDEVRTGPLQRVVFDNWPEAVPVATPALRYVTQDVTGYEELDLYGSWQEDADYGPLWLPRMVPVGWAPYSDGRWTWVAPWGWTWVDNAPWAYAPSHYGRWVLVGSRWCWAPGRERGRTPWAPALVGWVGGNHWQPPGQRPEGRPGQGGIGWYPLSPRDRYVPGYGVTPEYERRINRIADGRRPLSYERERRDGLTMLPGDRFGVHRTVDVPRGSRVTMPAPQLQNMPLTTAPPAAAGWQRPQVMPRREFETREWNRRPARLQTEALEVAQPQPDWRVNAPAPVMNPAAPRPPMARPPLVRPPIVTAPPVSVVSAPPPVPVSPPVPQMPAVPALPPVQNPMAFPRRERELRDERAQDVPQRWERERERRREPQPAPQPPAQPQAQPQPQPRAIMQAPEPRQEARTERPRENRENREMRRPQDSRQQPQQER